MKTNFRRAMEFIEYNIPLNQCISTMEPRTSTPFVQGVQSDTSSQFLILKASLRNIILLYKISIAFVNLLFSILDQQGVFLREMMYWWTFTERESNGHRYPIFIFRV